MCHVERNGVESKHLKTIIRFLDFARNDTGGQYLPFHNSRMRSAILASAAFWVSGS